MDPLVPPTIRPATVEDLEAITGIYGHHVLTGLASFEEMPPPLDEMRRRLEAVRGAGLPYLVAERDGGVAGYAYAAPYRTRSAYRYTLEDSVYIAPDAVGRGIGRALLARLVDESARLGYRQMVAVIGDSANRASIALHARLGFRHAGTLTAVGFKLGRWVDSVLMQRPLGEGAETGPAGEATGSTDGA